ncbi:MAG: fructose-6-phosphate aldolase [Alphaproteobacteria bacterium]
MKIFIDSADVVEIREAVSTGLVDGVTTNPTLAARTGRKFLDLIADICTIVPGPVSAEVGATDYAGMLAEGRILHDLGQQVAVKLPMTREGLAVCRVLANEGAMTNVTLCFSATQAILAAKAGATFVSPFAGRLDDVGADGMALIADIVRIFRNYDRMETEVLVASVRTISHVVEAARIGADVVTVPAKVFRQLFDHPLTDQGLARFVDDWTSSGLRIIG